MGHRKPGLPQNEKEQGRETDNMKTLIGYHFTGDKLRNGDPIPSVGKPLIYTGPVVPCKSGLHMSAEPFDALLYAPGPLLHLVELSGDLTPHGAPVNKYAGRQRTILASFDATDLLWQYARQQALSVSHLWDVPDVVRQYLTTGNESLRDAAWAAAADEAWGAAGDLAWDAAADAAKGAARATAWDAAWDAAKAAARVFVWTAAMVTAEDAFNFLIKEAFGEI